MAAMDVGADDIGVGVDRAVEYDHLFQARKFLPAMMLGAPTIAGRR